MSINGSDRLGRVSHWVFRCVAGLLLCAVGTMAWAAQAPLKPITFLTNYTFIGKYAPFFLGLDKGYYRDAGFDIRILPSTGSNYVISAIDGGQADYGLADAAPVIQAVAKGAQVRGFFVYMDKLAMGLASLKPYPTLESLRDQRIAVSPADSTRGIFQMILNENHLDGMPVHWELADPSVHFSLLLGGKVDLITASIDGVVPALQRVAEPRGEEVHFTLYADWGYKVYGHWLVTRLSTLQRHPDEVLRFAQATHKAVLYSFEHPEEAARSMADHNPALNYDTLLKQWRQSIKAMNTPATQQAGYGVATMDRLQDTIDAVGQALDLDITDVRPEDVFTRVLTAP